MGFGVEQSSKLAPGRISTTARARAAYLYRHLLPPFSAPGRPRWRAAFRGRRRAWPGRRGRRSTAPRRAGRPGRRRPGCPPTRARIRWRGRALVQGSATAANRTAMRVCVDLSCHRRLSWPRSSDAPARYKNSRPTDARSTLIAAGAADDHDGQRAVGLVHPRRGRAAAGADGQRPDHYTVRAAGGEVLSEYRAPCAPSVW